MATGPTLIFKWRGSGLKSRRSNEEKRLKEEGWGASLTDEEIDKLDFIERKMAREGVEGAVFVKGHAIDKVK